MKANELRIGNFIQGAANTCSSTLGYIEEVTPLFIHDKSLHNAFRFYNGIPITEEWLLKFGFEEEAMRYSRNIDLFGGGKKLCFSGDYLYIIDSEKQNTIPTDVVTIWNKDVKKEFYVHSLQNLYFALTGEELIIKQ
jgi:hypothetical protein